MKSAAPLGRKHWNEMNCQPIVILSFSNTFEWVFKSFCQLPLEMKFDIIKTIQYETII